jgi:hypothetical protein
LVVVMVVVVALLLSFCCLVSRINDGTAMDVAVVDDVKDVLMDI